MLSVLDIRDIVLIDSLRLDFTTGLCVLTGETGAGKSILLDSLSLALGGRGDTGLVRQGAAMASVTAIFSLATDHPARALFASHDLVIDPDEDVILRRQVKADGGSRAFINDRPVSLGLMREVGTSLVEIHGQHDERGFVNAAGHRALLDLFGGVNLADVRQAHGLWHALEDRLMQARAEADQARADQDWLAHAVDELRALAPVAGEEEELSRTRSLMLKGQKLREDFAALYNLFCNEDGVMAQLRQTARRLQKMAGEVEVFETSLDRIDQMLLCGEEVEADLQKAMDELDDDPARLEEIEDRLFALRGMARKHQIGVEELPDLLAKLEARLESLDEQDASLAALVAQEAAAHEAYCAACTTLTQARQDAAARLDKAVAMELPPLKLGEARFRTVVRPLPENMWGALGQDKVEFELAANPGADFAPLARAASGGELSRIILALKVVLAADAAHILIFDEVDRGVGGAVAQAVGDRLARLAHTTQVLAITHSPQVAARGDCQWRVAKSIEQDKTRVAVALLSPEERLDEIARMLSGFEVTAEARAHALRLLRDDREGQGELNP